MYTDVVHTHISRSIKSDVFCIVNEENVRRRAAGLKGVYDDDCGTWSTEDGKIVRHSYIALPDGVYKHLFLKDGVYTKEKYISGKRSYVALEPQPNINEVFTVCRYYAKQKGNNTYKKRVSWLDGATERKYAIVEYVGQLMLPMPHGNVKTSTEPFIRTPQMIIQHAASTENEHFSINWSLIFYESYRYEV